MNDQELGKLVRQYKTKQNQIARAEEARKLLADLIKAEMRARQVDQVRIGHHCVSLRTVTSLTVDVAALREGSPDVARLYQVDRTVERLLVS